MVTVGAFEAKTHFSQLLVQVVAGETIIITKHGEPIARLTPMDQRDKVLGLPMKAVAAIRALRQGVKLGKKLSLKQLIQEGRKW